MHQGDYNSVSYYPYPHPQNPNPTPTIPNPNLADLHQNSYASAPPFTNSYTPSDYPAYPPNYPPYSQNSDPVPPPTAPSYNPPPPVPSATTPALNPNSLQSSFHPPQQSQPPNFPPYESHGPYQPAATQQSYYPPFDQNSAASSYAPPPPPPPSSIAPNPNPSANTPYSSMYSGPPYNSLGSSVPPAYDNSYENTAKFDYGVGYFDDKYGGYNRSGSDLGSDLYNKRSESRYDMGRDDGYGDGVYAYEGGRMEPYGARGTAPKSSNSALFDDYGRAISFPSGKDSSAGSVSGSGKIVRAVPKAETQQDVKSGVQKFRVKLLAESGGQSTMDVLCQIGLDGIRMLDPNTSRTLRIYPLENITRCDKTDSSTFAFWSKSSVDIEPRRIRLQSNSYTTNTLLDTVTAATVQIKEMGARSRPTDFSKTTDQSTEKKKGLVDWMNLMKPGNEEKDHWVPDEAVSKCTACGTDFGAFVRRHHCRNCGDIFCDKCTHGRTALTAEENAQPVRVCDRCLAEVTQRLSNAKEAANKPAGLQSHEDLARKLQEEMEKNRKASSGSKSDGGYGSGRRMKEVACPTCTVHLQVQVPSSGSETIECGVCQHPFLVSAN
ncbi:protein FREE1 [Euphorbia lathyris]|uniref:protein FREE1 n=1 Tax=Euphorbia lathyris TaxID=212925 RepID=UPI0033135AF0